MNSKKNTHKSLLTLEHLILFSSTVVSFLFLLWLLWASQYGLELTDEGYYLVWIATPNNYSISVSQFGFIYYPLYLLLDGDISLVRQANILITFSLSLILLYIALIEFLSNSLSKTYIALMSVSLASLSLLLFTQGLFTPSYNTLNLQAVLITVIGLLLIHKITTSSNVIGWILIGVGGWLSFMAKPSTAGLLFVIVFLYLIFSKKIKTSMLLLTLITILLLMAGSAVLIDESMLAFINRFKEGMEIAKLLGAGHTLLNIIKLDLFYPSSSFIITFIIFVGLLFSIVSVAKRSNDQNLKGFMFLFLFIELMIIAFLFTNLSPLIVIDHRGLLIWIIPLTIFLIYFKLLKNKASISNLKLHFLIPLLLVLPHTYAFGSSVNYWIAGSAAGIFPVLASILFINIYIPNKNQLLLIIVLIIFSQAITIIAVTTGVENPYRQPKNLLENKSRLSIGKDKSPFILSSDFKRYFLDAISLTQQAGFKLDTPMIDLTGHSPTLLFALGAKSSGQAWTIGGYPGSYKIASISLAKVSCKELATAWIVDEVAGPRSIDPSILLSFGANLSSDYKLIGSIDTPDKIVDYYDIRTQRIYKPTRDLNIAITKCDATRTKTQ